MYQFSRAIYRELAEQISEPAVPRSGPTNHERLAFDRHYFARPARTLFQDIRAYFPMCNQARVYVVVKSYLELADEWLERQGRQGYDVNGNPLQCRATTRKGSPCQRMPLPHNGYCPSHQHLAETEENVTRELETLAA
jgi:uncharacterized protein DUF5763